MTKTVVLTGDRPTGSLHLGHYVGSLENRIMMQETHDMYVMVADVQALTDNFENPQKVRDNIVEVVKDYLAVGIDPQKATIFLQSQIKEIAELTVFYLNLVNLGRLERNPTVKHEMKQKGLGENIPVGFLCYPVSQAADITVVKATLVPVGEDQLPMIEQTNEIVRKFNRIYNSSCLKEAQALMGRSKRLVGIDGSEKASKSLGNAILLSDSTEELRRKVFAMYTDPDHLKVSDPGKVEGNAVFKYLDSFYNDAEHLNELKSHYQRGGLGDISLKQILFECLEKFLVPIRNRRELIKDSEIYEIIADGVNRTRKVAESTLDEVYDAMSILKL